MLNLTELATFLAVVEEGSFSGAANWLGVAQPTVSQHLRKLEEELDVTLVIRDRLKAIPTACGARLLPHARSLLGGLLERAMSSPVGAWLWVQLATSAYICGSHSLLGMHKKTALKI